MRIGTACLYIFALSLLPLNIANAEAAAAEKIAPRQENTTEDPYDRYKKSLQSKCDNGIASACYQLGTNLADSDIPEDRKKAGFYIRRACMMAYAPACGRETSSASGNETKIVGVGCFTPDVFNNLSLRPAKNSSGGDAQKFTDVDKLPIFASAGVKPGDVILSINGKPFRAPSQIADGLDSGKMNMEIERDGKVIPLNVACPK